MITALPTPTRSACLVAARGAGGSPRDTRLSGGCCGRRVRSRLGPAALLLPPLGKAAHAAYLRPQSESGMRYRQLAVAACSTLPTGTQRVTFNNHRTVTAETSRPLAA